MKELFTVSWRSIWRNKRRTIITVASVALSLSVAVFFIAMADGMYGHLLHQVLRMQSGNVTIEHARYRSAPAIDLSVDNIDALRARIAGMPQVEGTKALVLGQGIASSSNGSVEAAIMGVEPAVEAAYSMLNKRLVAGQYLSGDDQRTVIIGTDMAEKLKVAIGNKLVLSSTNIDGEVVQQLVHVRGLFKTGSVDLDGHVVQLSIALARRMLGLGPRQATQLAVILRDPDAEVATMDRIRGLLADHPAEVVLPWQQVMPDLASFMKVDKGSNYVFQGIIIFLMMFTIFNTILMSVLERTREFGIMLALGSSPMRIKLQVLLESALLGLLGIVIGIGLGGAAAGLLQVYGLDLRLVMKETMDVGGFALDPILHGKVSLEVLVFLGGSVLLAILLMSLVPMRRIDRIRVTDLFR